LTVTCVLSEIGCHSTDNAGRELGPSTMPAGRDAVRTAESERRAAYEPALVRGVAHPDEGSLERLRPRIGAARRGGGERGPGAPKPQPIRGGERCGSRGGEGQYRPARRLGRQSGARRRGDGDDDGGERPVKAVKGRNAGRAPRTRRQECHQSHASAPEAPGVDAKLTDLVADDPLGGVQEPGRLRSVAAGRLEGVANQVLFQGAHRRGE
jgi:hypothetical protein